MQYRMVNGESPESDKEKEASKALHVRNGLRSLLSSVTMRLYKGFEHPDLADTGVP